MKKILVIGCPGSGKSTFSKELHKKTGIPLHHLDMMYWNADGTTVDKSLFLKRIDSVLKEETWILDGNYASTLSMRLKACDTIFFLDISTEICLRGIKERKGKPRSDLPWIEPEEDDEQFIDFIKNYHVINRPEVLRLIKEHSDKQVVIFHQRQEADTFLSRL